MCATQNNMKMSPLANLPFDVLVNVFQYLQTRDLLRVRRVSDVFKEAVENSKSIRLELDTWRDVMAGENDEGFIINVRGPEGDPFVRSVSTKSLFGPPRDSHFLFSNVQSLTVVFDRSGLENSRDRTQLETLTVGILNHVRAGIFTRLYYINLLGLFFPEQNFLLNMVDMFPSPLYAKAEIYPRPGQQQSYIFTNNIKCVSISVRQYPDMELWPRDKSPIFKMFGFARGHLMDKVSLHNLGRCSVEQFCEFMAGANIKELLLYRTGVVGTVEEGNHPDFLTQIDKLVLKYSRMRVQGANEHCSLREIDAEHVSLNFFRTFSFSKITTLSIMLFPEQAYSAGLLMHLPQLLNLTLTLPDWNILYNMPDKDFESSLVSQLKLVHYSPSPKGETPSPHSHSMIQKLEKLQHLEHLEITSNYDIDTLTVFEMPFLHEFLYLQLKQSLRLKSLRMSKRYSVKTLDVLFEYPLPPIF